MGAGPVAIRKAQTLLEAGARVVIVADTLDEMPAIQKMGENVELIKSKYSKSYLAEAVLVIAATNNVKVNRQIYKDCQQLEILCNVVDEPQMCDFFVPAVVKRGGLQIAVSTDGGCPALAGHIRNKLEKIFTDKHGEFLAELTGMREQVIEKVEDPPQRKALLGKLADDDSFEFFSRNGSIQWRKWAENIVKQQ